MVKLIVQKSFFTIQTETMSKLTQLDFSGTTIYCGIDVHLKSWRVHIRDEEMELRDLSQNPDPVLLSNFLKKHYPGATYKVGYEAGFCGFHIQRRLTSLGIQCVVLNAADIPKGNKDKRQKNDKRDARNISEEIKKKTVGIYVPSLDWEYGRSLVRTREQQIADSTRMKARIWQFLYFHGLAVPGKEEVGKYWSRRFIEHLQAHDCNNNAQLKAALQIMLADYIQKRKLLFEVIKAIRQLYRQEPYKKQMELLLSIPGIGEINAAIILFELQHIHRFKTFDQLCSYVGFIPDTDDSGETKRDKGITHRFNKGLRKALVESSWVVIRQDPALLMKYKAYCKRMHKNKAIVRVAKHLLARIRFVLKEQKKYVEGVLAG
ncbi:MAG TPA: IS110 family transposase [Nitrososphaera sp.]|nr:IS110 family transposase [Nitrososphaera sp.]